MTSEIDTTNKYLVSRRGGDILILATNARLSKENALNLAAWLVALADDGTAPHSFAEILRAVQNT